MKQKLYYLPFLAVVLSACDSNNDAPVGIDKPDETGIVSPTSVETGERFVVESELEGDNVTLSVEPEAYTVEASQGQWAIVAPSGYSAPVELTLTLTNDDETATGIVVIEQPSPKNFDELPKPYPFVTSWLPSYENGPTDANGVPMFQYGSDTDYFPIQISKVGQALYNLVYQGVASAEQEALFINVSDWLRDNCVYTKWGFCSWRTDIDVPAYQLPDEWTSAMAQGQAISALVGAYAYTGDSSYLEVVYDALAAFNYPIEEMGVRADYDGVPWYEEYGSEIEPAHVLNGFLFGIAGVYDAYEILGSRTAKQVYDVGIDSLVARIDRYDLGFTSWYDDSSLEQIASMKSGIGDSYHELHVFQLLWAYEHSQEEILLEHADKFLQYDTRGVDSFVKFKDITQKITEVSASSVYSDRFTEDLLIDSNWTWKRYWAADANPTTLTLKLNGESANNNIVLNGIRLSTVKLTDLPDTMTLYSCEESPVLLDGPFKPVERIGEPFEILLDNYYRSNTVVVDTQELELPCNDLLMEMTPNPESGLIRFRELNLHFSQPAALQEIRNFYMNQYTEE